MTLEEMKEIFDKDKPDIFDFDTIPDPPSKRKDLTAMIMLDKLFPDKGDIISCAEHDMIYFSIDCDKLCEIITENDILYLMKCGIFYKYEENCLCMFT